MGLSAPASLLSSLPRELTTVLYYLSSFKTGGAYRHALNFLLRRRPPSANPEKALLQRTGVPDVHKLTAATSGDMITFLPL